MRTISTVITLAAEHGGYLSRAQLQELGVHPSSIERGLRSGRLTQVVEGIYQVFPSNDHVDLLRGALLALPDAVVSHESAAHVLDFPRLPNLRPTVTIASHRTHAFPGVMVRRNDDIDASHVIEVDALRVTTVARTAFDLGSVLRFREFEDIAEALILAGRMTEDEFGTMTGQLARRGKPGSRAARDFLELRAGALPGSSVLERRGRQLIAEDGLPTPVPEFPIPWAIGQRFDDAYPEAKLAIEWDSRAWHLQRTAMEADRKRDRLAAMHGWTVIRITGRTSKRGPKKS